MPRFMGLDLHKAYVHGYVFQAGQKGTHFRFPNTPEHWDRFLTTQVTSKTWIARSKRPAMRLPFMIGRSRAPVKSWSRTPGEFFGPDVDEGGKMSRGGSGQPAPLADHTLCRRMPHMRDAFSGTDRGGRSNLGVWAMSHCGWPVVTSMLVEDRPGLSLSKLSAGVTSTTGQELPAFFSLCLPYRHPFGRTGIPRRRYREAMGKRMGPSAGRMAWKKRRKCVHRERHLDNYRCSRDDYPDRGAPQFPGQRVWPNHQQPQRDSVAGNTYIELLLVIPVFMSLILGVVTVLNVTQENFAAGQAAENGVLTWVTDRKSVV